MIGSTTLSSGTYIKMLIGIIVLLSGITFAMMVANSVYYYRLYMGTEHVTVSITTSRWMFALSIMGAMFSGLIFFYVLAKMMVGDGFTGSMCSMPLPTEDVPVLQRQPRVRFDLPVQREYTTVVKSHSPEAVTTTETSADDYAQDY
jgi:hypothetical protein